MTNANKIAKIKASLTGNHSELNMLDCMEMNERAHAQRQTFFKAYKDYRSCDLCKCCQDHVCFLKEKAKKELAKAQGLKAEAALLQDFYLSQDEAVQAFQKYA